MIPEHIKTYCNEKEAVIVCEYIMHKDCKCTCLFAIRTAAIPDIGFGAMDEETAKGLPQRLTEDQNN